jgi:hypothetical protein
MRLGVGHNVTDPRNTDSVTSNGATSDTYIDIGVRVLCKEISSVKYHLPWCDTHHKLTSDNGQTDFERGSSQGKIFPSFLHSK